MSEQTIAEKILTRKSGRHVRAGDIVMCDVDVVLGTDASAPMAIDYFERMGGDRLFDPRRVIFALDHYAPPSTPSTASFHDRVRAFAAAHGAEVRRVGDGISHQLVVEAGRAVPGDLIVGADSHTVTCGAFNLFAVGVGSSDLAAAMITGQVWLRVPASIRVTLSGRLTEGVSAKDLGLALVARLGGDGANYQALEFNGPALGSLTIDDRLVLCNLAVEAGAKAAIFPADRATEQYMMERSACRGACVEPDVDARYTESLAIDLSAIDALVALPHAPDNVVRIGQAIGTPVQMVFIGTCAGGRARDVREALAVLERAGGQLAPGVQLVITPASREVHDELFADGTLGRLVAMGAVVTTAGCGACCGTSGVIPGDGINVLSTANRNFKARMGSPTAAIYLASPAACAAAAATGCITDPRTTKA